MDLLPLATEGLQTIAADAALKEQALKHLRLWLTEADFAPYRPQLEWLIHTKQWAGLLGTSEVKALYGSVNPYAFNLDRAREELAKSSVPKGFKAAAIYPDSRQQNGLKRLQGYGRNRARPDG